MKALGIVIFSHILSLMSRPESGAAMAFTTVTISVLSVSGSPSGISWNPAPIEEKPKHSEECLK